MNIGSGGRDPRRLTQWAGSHWMIGSDTLIVTKRMLVRHRPDHTLGPDAPQDGDLSFLEKFLWQPHKNKLYS
jgi:hypothetical protein